VITYNNSCTAIRNVHVMAHKPVPPLCCVLLRIRISATFYINWIDTNFTSNWNFCVQYKTEIIDIDFSDHFIKNTIQSSVLFTHCTPLVLWLLLNKVCESWVSVNWRLCRGLLAIFLNSACSVLHWNWSAGYWKFYFGGIR
jgi:hypothetical protein